MAVKTDPSRTACREQSRTAYHEQSQMAYHKQNRMACVVALLPAGAEVKKAPDPFFTRVGSGYEAAAELLSRPVSALLVDLAALPATHAGLLKLAAGLDVPVVAFGTVSASLDGSALAGVRLVGAEDVSDALREVKKGSGAFFSSKATSTPQRDVTEEKKAPDPFFTEPLTRDELDALLSD